MPRGHPPDPTTLLTDEHGSPRVGKEPLLGRQSMHEAALDPTRLKEEGSLLQPSPHPTLSPAPDRNLSHSSTFIYLLAPTQTQPPFLPLSLYPVFQMLVKETVFHLTKWLPGFADAPTWIPAVSEGFSHMDTRFLICKSNNNA